MQSINMLRELSNLTGTLQCSRSSSTIPKSDFLNQDDENVPNNYNKEDDGWTIEIKVYPSRMMEDEGSAAGESATAMQSMSLLRQLRRYSNGGTTCLQNVDSSNVCMPSSAQKRGREVLNSENGELSPQLRESIEQPREQQQRAKRRRILPNEVIDDVLQFLSHGECNQAYVTNYTFCQLLEPRRKLCFQLVWYLCF